MTITAAGTPGITKLDFSLTPEAVKAAYRAALKKSAQALDGIAALPDGDRGFENTILALDRVVSDLETETRAGCLLKYVGVEKAVREAGHDAETEVSNFLVDVFSREDLFRAVRAAAEAGGTPGESGRKLADKTLRDFRMSGLGLPPVERARFNILKKHLVKMELDFGKNLNDADSFLAVTREELEGLPKDYIDRLAKLPAGRFKVTLDYPDVFPFLMNAEDGDARRRLQFLMHNRAMPENLALLEEILTVRRRLAVMLGYKSHAETVLEDRMAKGPGTVLGFLGRLRKRVAPLGEENLVRLLAEKRMDDPDAKVVEPWDMLFYHNRIKKSDLAVDDEAVRAYFPAEKVTAGVLACYQDLLGLRFEENKNTALWHPDVRCFTVRDGGEVLGEFYLDLYPREGKYKHAAAFPLVRGRREPDGSYRRPSAAMVANFNQPAAGRPALWLHSEVRTFFHEFGHIMHNICTRAEYPRFAGTSVTRDFVEVPSTMFEEWAWRPEVLRRISGHFETGAPLPEDLLARMIGAKNLHTGLMTLRSVALAWTDQEYHGEKEADSTEVYRRLSEEIAMIPIAEGTHPHATIGHFAGGYDAGYYTYLWSEVYALDMFSRFERDGVFDPLLGRLYRKAVLEPGGSGDELEYIRKFLGREPTEEAFYRSIGLGAASATSAPDASGYRLSR